MSTNHTIKVLLSGAVHGRLGNLFKKVAGVNAKNGPFDALFCVGGFFEGGAANEQLSLELREYLKGEKKAPVPTYFIGGCGQGCGEGLMLLEESGQAGNVHYLGRYGVKQVAGLNLVFLDGQDGRGAGKEADAFGRFTKAEVKDLKKQIDTMEGDVDILLTCDWPQGVTQHVPQELLPPRLQSSEPAQCSSTVAQVASLARPRYHFAGGVDVHFARPPYLNKDLGAGVRTTRFISLASFNNSSKEKSLHALGLTPAAMMTPEQLSQTAEGCTPSPYDKGKGAGSKHGLDADADAAGAATSADWRWSKKTKREMAAPSLGRPGVIRDTRKTIFVRNLPFAATEDQIDEFFSVCGEVVDFRRTLNPEGNLNSYGLVQFKSEEAVERACNMNGTELMGRPLYIDVSTLSTPNKEDYGKPAPNCWFCLSSDASDVSLVVSVAEHAYMTLDKGPINDYHALVIPIEHYPSMVSLPVPAFVEVERYLSAVRSCFAAMGKELVAFERHLRFRNQAAGNHCHINIAPIPASAAKSAKSEFMRAAEAAGFQPTELPRMSGESGREQLREVAGDGAYFQFILPDGSRCVQPLGQGDRWPLNLGREVIAKLAGVPERADWKAATHDTGQVERLVEQYKEQFKDYDIM